MKVSGTKKNSKKVTDDEIKPLEPYIDEMETSKLKGKKLWTWPVTGSFAHFYTYWMLCNSVYYLLFVIPRISFEDKPQYFVVLIDFYLSFVYAIDMIRCFTEPFVMDGKLIANRTAIILHYLKTWFIFDL
jgi:hypothetical protein